MKYQSELIKEIVDTRGHKESSLHYESECMETWIEEAKGAYPKLCDYESEWLNYISILDDTGGGEDPEPPIGEFPYIVLSDVTEATIDNVVPYAYKSAILRGDTLVNVVTEQGFGGNDMIYESRFIDSPFNARETFTIFVVNPNVTTIKVGIFQAATGDWLREQQYNISDNKRIVYTVPAGLCCKYVAVVVNRGNDATGFENSLVIVSGDKSNLEIENYFEGMQSVEMPVLKTFNNHSNLFFTQTLTDFYDWRCIRFDTFINAEIYVKAASTVSNTLRMNIIQNINGATKENMHSNDSIKKGVNVKVENVQYIGFHDIPNGIAVDKNGNLLELIESGKLEIIVSDKSNILTVNENVVLRGIGDVKDELDLLTGELTERIGEVVLDENTAKNFTLSGISDNTVSFWCMHNATSPFVNISRGEDLKILLTDKIPRKSNFNEDVELIHSGTGAVVLRIL